MKKLLLSILTILGVATMFAQTIVSTTPENRNVVLEEFTGIHCVFCPDGHRVGNEYANANPGDVLLINIHTGGYAEPNTGEPDFRTSFGSAIAGQSGLTGYPAGTINRHIFPGNEQGSGTAMSRSKWALTGNEVLAEASYLNIGATAVIDVATRMMTINVEVYYTGNSTETSNWLNVVVLQNNVEGPQTGGSTFYPEMVLPNGNYLHQHMLKDMITGQWGEEITTTTTGSLHVFSADYPIPSDYIGVEAILGYMELGVFVTETHQEAVSGIKVEPTFVNIVAQNDVSVSSIVLPNEFCGTEIAPVVNIQNLAGIDLTSLTFEYDVNGGTPATYTWTGNLTYFQTSFITLDPIAFVSEATNTVTITATLPNGISDENTTDNTVSGTFGLAPSSYSTIHFTLATDQWGSETTWEFTDDAGTVIASGGAYSDASSATVNIVEDIDIALPSLGCYTFTIWDAYGDGISSSTYGLGYFTVTDSEGNAIFDGGAFAAVDIKSFEVTNMSAAIEINDFDGGVSVVPNPVRDMAFIELSLQTSQDVQFKLYNVQGQLVKLTEEFVNSNSHRTSFDVSTVQAGIYFLSIESANSTYTQKLIVE